MHMYKILFSNQSVKHYFPSYDLKSCRKSYPHNRGTLNVIFSGKMTFAPGIVQHKGLELERPFLK